MSDEAPVGPDFAAGIAVTDLVEGQPLLGHVGSEPVLLTTLDGARFAIGATCTHQGAPLADGLPVDGTVRCAWHHACFDLRTGAVRRAPALDPVAAWRIEERDGRVFVRERIVPPTTVRAGTAPARTFVIVGAGAAGAAAAGTLRDEGFDGRVIVLGADPDAPYDRTTLSKGVLAGATAVDAVALHPAEFYRERAIELKLGATAQTIDAPAKQIVLASGERVAYDALLLATGAEPRRLAIPGAGLPHVHVLRTLADARAILGGVAPRRSAIVIGASFIGLEVAAALRSGGCEVDVVGTETVPMTKVLGAETGAYLRTLHEEHGVRFHLGAGPRTIDADGVTLESGTRLTAAVVVVGIGVEPRLALAESAGCALDRGVTVDAFLETSVPGIFAAGDIARWPDPISGERIRVEHWVVAERQGQVAARNMLGKRQRFESAPFFWTDQYDFNLCYVGHAERWDEAPLEGSLAARDASITYRKDGAIRALATVHRDALSLATELALERGAAR